MPTYALATIELAGQPTAAIQVGDQLWPLAEATKSANVGELPARLTSLIDDWPGSRGALARLAHACAAGNMSQDALTAGEATYLAPILYPRKLIGVGANYADHVEKAMVILERMGIQRGTGRHTRPTFFFKPPSTAVVGPGATVRMPINCRQFDYEIELGLVFGARVRDVAESEAMAAVAGYTIGLDMSARDLHFIPDSLFKFDAFAGKGHDTGAPLGPLVVPAEFVPNPQNLRMRLEVNGELRQDGSTSDMVHRLPRLISEVSKIVTIEPGDVMLTGTPAGTGFETGRFLAIGDRLTASIEGLGKLEVTVVP